MHTAEPGTSGKHLDVSCGCSTQMFVCVQGVCVYTQICLHAIPYAFAEVISLNEDGLYPFCSWNCKGKVSKLPSFLQLVLYSLLNKVLKHYDSLVL